MPELILKLGDSIIQTFVFDKDIMSVGRSRDNDVVIENLSVSRNHARIRRQTGKYILTDLNSANGTFVNGVRVSKTEIVHDDVITIGKHKLVFSNKALSEEQAVCDALAADRTMMMEKSPVGVLCIMSGKNKGKEFHLTKFETTVGKAQSNDVVLSDEWFISRKQAVIRRRGNDFELQDLGTFRRTKVNNKALSEPVPLSANDIIEFGNTRCVFQYTHEAAEPQPSGRMPQELGLEDSIFSSAVEPGPYAPPGGVPEEPVAPAASFTPAVDTHPEPVVEEVAYNVELEEAPVLEVPVSEAPAPEPVASVPSGRSGKKKKRGRGADFSTERFGRGEVAQAKIADVETAKPAPEEPQVVEGDLDEEVQDRVADESPAVAEEKPREEIARFEAVVSAARTGEVGSEVALWEGALNNKSPVIRKHAAQILKKLTGKDYET
jgi:pSer/pThr/pTyr-binding forkhead associated (FHA) protein